MAQSRLTDNKLKFELQAFRAAVAQVRAANTSALGNKADLDSPILVGDPEAPTPPPGTDNDQLATTAFVVDALAGATAGMQPADSDLAAIAALATTAFGRALLTLADAAALTAAINAFTSTLKGTVPASGGGTVNFLRADGGWAPPVASVAFSTVEADLGSVPLKSGSFTIAGLGLTVGKPVYIQQAVGPYTGKGTLADEAEMDQVSVTASVTSATQITVYWTCPCAVRGNFKFNYRIGA